MKFGEYIIYRLLGLVLQVIGAVGLTFVMLRLVPFDPTLFFLINYRGSNSARRAELLAELRSQLGLDVPVYIQFYRFFRNFVVHGSLGTSWSNGLAINGMIINALPSTLITFGLGFLIYTPLAITLGIISASKRGGKFDNFVRVSTTATYAIPSYIVGLWVVIYAIPFNLAPWPHPGPQTLVELLKYSILPILVVVFIYTGFQFRLVRAHMLGILRQDYIRTARAKGLDERTILYKHALRNGLPFFITSIAVTFPIAFSGVAALEIVFGIPGIGYLMVVAANGFDWPVLIAVTAVFTFFNALLLGITDIAVYYLTPKLRYDQRFTPN